MAKARPRPHRRQHRRLEGSAVLHALAGALQGFEVQYDLLVPAEVGLGFDALLDRCAQGSYRGINVTHPYKERAAARVEIENPLVRAIGAVNLVRFDSDRKRGFNTDYSGFLAAWRAKFGADTPGIVCQVGAGGAGKAFAFALAELGADAIRLVDIDGDRARGLAGALRESYPELDAAARVELDPVKRKAIYADVQWILHEEGSTIVPLFQNLVHGISDTIDTGGDILGAQPLDTFRVFEKWSFKA